ncbi:hypothetical protein F5883DRAFT_685403 [Diaporthe sp. PMI_573]|nr:hypothetical protein F5883DRAFT_685403 [Diaporthaceae sp. PMI_573]
MSARTLNWFESEADAINIQNNSWNLQLAKAVASGSAAPTYNMIWKSRALALITSISWKVEYALGWTAQVPDSGMSIRITGKWQPCNKGESFDINPMGYWQRSTEPVEAQYAGWLNVGKIQYSYPGVLGIHIVVGIRNAESGLFEPIFVDKATLGRGSSGRYQPQESVSWWLEAGDRTGSVFSGTKSGSATQDFSNPSGPVTNTFEWSTSFLTIPSKWVIAGGIPAQSMAAPPPSAQLAPMSLGGEAPMILKLKDKFRRVEITIEGKTGNKLRVMYEAGNGNAPGTVATIEKALRDMLNSGDIPAGESRKISADTTPSALDLTSLSNSLASSTAVVRHAPQTAQPNISGNASAGFPQQQQQSNGDTIVPKGPFNEAYPNGVITV